MRARRGAVLAMVAAVAGLVAMTAGRGAVAAPPGGTSTTSTISTSSTTSTTAAPAVPAFSINDVSVVEGNSGTTNAVFTVTLSGAPSAPATVSYVTGNGTATAPSDYVTTAGLLTFASAGTMPISVPVNGDTTPEGNETFTVTLSNPSSGTTIARATGTGTIVDDDGNPALSIDDVSVVEGDSGTVDATFTVTLAPAATGSVSVSYATADGTATSPSDYLATAGVLSFPAGTKSQSLTVKVNGDTVDEPNEYFLVKLSNPSGAAVADGQGVGTIVDDDGGTQPDPVYRLAGADRIETAIAVSRDSFPANGSAGAVVLSRADRFPDALAGAPLAAVKQAPILLTPTDGLDAGAGAEIRRVLPGGKTVYLLGGDRALAPAVASQVAAMGYQVVRLAGADAFATAVQIANAAGPPVVIIEATGVDFPDALAGGAAAVQQHGVVVLTDGTTMPQSTAGYIAAHPATPRFALGGPAAKADPKATPVVGADRYDTSARVAARFFSRPPVAAVASGQGFADSLAGGPHVGAKGGPLLLVTRDAVPAVVRSYLSTNRSSITGGYLYGGTVVVSEAVRRDVQAAITTG
jgi:Calx-beta domain/ell wall binding domain 2 (CWB2)